MDKKLKNKRKLPQVKIPSINAKSIFSKKTGDKKKEVDVKTKEKKKLTFDINIKLQLLFGFTIPVIFVILVGIISYNKAEEGMITNYEISAQNTIDTQMDYLDFGFFLIRGDVTQLKLDMELQCLVGGMYKNDQPKASTLINQTNSSIIIKKTLNEFINNIYIIPKSDQKVISTKRKSTTRETNEEYGYYEEWSKTEEGKAVNSSQITGWISAHPELDKLTTYDPEEYVLSFMTPFPNKAAVLVVDINKEKVRETLSSIDVTDGALIAYITAEGKEIVVKEDTNSTEIVFFEQEFFKNCLLDEDKNGSQYVTYNGKEYLYIYRTSEETGATLAYLVPKEKVTASAAEIKKLTLVLVIIASIVAALIGVGISLNITTSMSSIIKRLKKKTHQKLTVLWIPFQRKKP